MNLCIEKKVSPAILTALILYLDKGYEFEVQKGTLDIKYPQKNHTKYSSLQSSNLELVKAPTPLYLLGSLWGISLGLASK